MLTVPVILSTHFFSPVLMTLRAPKTTGVVYVAVFTCFHIVFSHFGDFNFQVFTLRAFFEYLNDFISVGWDCHFYNLACRIVISGLLANISLSV